MGRGSHTLFSEIPDMPKPSLSFGLVALAAAVMLPAQAQAEHENRYFGFGYYPPGYAPPPVVYPPPPRIREVAPGVYEYEVAPGRWVRARPGYVYPPRQERQQRARTPQQQPQARRIPVPPPVPQRKPEATDEPEVTVERSPVTTPPTQAPVQSAEPVESAAQEAPASTSGGISCEAAADIVESFGFSDVQSTSCSGDTYGFDGTRDGKPYSIKLSAADGELTEVRKR
jgi:hypothetical protein